MNGGLNPKDETLIAASQTSIPELGQCMEDGGFSQWAWRHSKSEQTQLIRETKSPAGYQLFLLLPPVHWCVHGFLSAGLSFTT